MRRSQNNQHRITINPKTQNGAQTKHAHNGAKNSKARNFSGLHLLFSGLWKLYIGIKYLAFSFTRTWFSKSNILWMKIGVAGFAILMVMRNDFQFTINLSGNPGVEEETSSTPLEKVGVAHSMALTPSAPALTSKKTKRVEAANKAKVTRRITDMDVEQYILEHESMAKQEMQRFGIPASLKMAQAILASGAGTHDYALDYNNHFGRPLKGIQFDNSQTNWRAHSLYLIENYPKLLTVGSDYMDWVKALEKTNYSNQNEYSKNLLKVIKEYKLYQLDY